MMPQKIPRTVGDSDSINLGCPIWSGNGYPPSVRLPAAFASLHRFRAEAAMRALAASLIFRRGFFIAVAGVAWVDAAAFAFRTVGAAPKSWLNWWT